MDDLLTILLAAAAGVYLLASGWLFVFGSNLTFLSVVATRGGRRRDEPGSPTADGETSTGGNDPASVTVLWPSVTVQLPIFNELYVAERVVRAAAELDYPADRLHIQVLDDSTDETSVLIGVVVDELRQRGVNIDHLHRSDREGYKAGALAAGLAVSDSELVAVFDADFLPPADFLRRTVGHFATDERLAFVQTRWGHLNGEFSWLTRLQSLAIDGHFMVEQAARRHRGYWFNFNGTAGIWRRAAIDDAGGWTSDTLTEDLDLSYRAHLRGWHGHFRGDIEVPSELPAQMSSFRRQQHRWARGSIECARKLLPAVWRADASIGTRFQATMHLTAYGVHLLLFTLALLYPLIVLAGARYPGVSTLFGVGYLFALSSLTPAVFFLAGQRLLGRRWWRSIGPVLAVTVLGSGMMVNTVRAVFQIRTRPNPAFERTAKYGLATEPPVDDGPPAALGSESDSSVGAATANRWTHQRYQLDVDRIVIAEAALALYSIGSVMLAVANGNWGIAAYASVFATGLTMVVGLTLGQGIAVRRSSRARHRRMAAEAQRWSGRPAADDEAKEPSAATIAPRSA
ncbi:MAG: glycosyltransferase [Actinomycetota bacterium]